MAEPVIPVVLCTDGVFPHMIGGIQRHSRLLALALAASGEVDLTVIHPHAGIQVFPTESGIREIALQRERTSGTYLLDCYRYSQQVLNEVVRFPHAVIYAQGLSIWAGMRQVTRRLILNPHGLEAFQALSFADRFAGFPFRTIMRHQFRHAHYVVSLGGRLTEIIKTNSGQAEVVLLPNAVELPQMQPRSFDSPVTRFLFVGRFAYNKGIDILLETVKELNDEGLASQTAYSLVGTGPLLEELRKKYPLKNVTFAGFATDEKLSELYRQNDIFVLPTLFEGMPTVVLEAMANGMPIIVTDTGATTDMVDDRNGIIIDKRSVPSLKEAIRKCIVSGPGYRKACSDASLEKVRSRYTWKQVADQHIRVFRKLHEQMS